MGTRDVESEGSLDDPDTAPDDSDDGLDDDETFTDSADDNAPANEDADATEEAAAAPRRRNTGIWLLGLGAGTWALVAALRCSSTPVPAGPSLAVGPEEADGAETPAEPAAVEPSPEAPKPAIETDAPAPAPAPEKPRFVEPHGEPATWARDLEPPSVVRYTVRRGGTIENIANLFKIYHHRIQELNPGVALDRPLPPDTKVTVYKASSDASESVGLPSHGSLEGAVPMVEGPGRRLMAIPWKSWATGRTVALLDAVLRQWAKRGSGVQPILVGNMSSPNGGRLPPHSTHQSGRDVDLGYVQKMRAGEEHNWREMTANNLDAAQTWELLRLLAQTGQVEVIYIDRSIQKLLHEHAVKTELMTPRELSRWMEYPRPTGAGNPLIQHVAGHVDHLHVRFSCAVHEKRCRSRESS